MTDCWQVFLRVVAVAVTTLGFSLNPAPVKAADIDVMAAPASMHDWSGFYGGIHGGYAWGDYDYSGGVFAGGANAKPDDAIFGFLLGWNHQMDNLVIGIEGDASISYAYDRSTVGAVQTRADIDALFSWRARIGYAMDSVLIYGTGGVGLLETRTRAPGFEDEENHWGFVVGGGVEWALSDAWSVRGEYLYGSFSEENQGAGISLDPEIHVARAALVWNFSSMFGGY
ncbi:MAG: outer membrane protein [Hyphomicrobiales bacterium]